MMDVLRRSVVATNRFGAGELDELRIRMALISTVPALVAHSAVRYAEWCDVVAGFAARRIGALPTTSVPRRWPVPPWGPPWPPSPAGPVTTADDLAGEVDRAFRLLATGFDE